MVEKDRRLAEGLEDDLKRLHELDRLRRQGNGAAEVNLAAMRARVRHVSPSNPLFSVYRQLNGFLFRVPSYRDQLVCAGSGKASLSRRRVTHGVSA